MHVFKLKQWLKVSHSKYFRQVHILLEIIKLIWGTWQQWTFLHPPKAQEIPGIFFKGFYATARHNLILSGLLTWNHNVKNRDSEKKHVAITDSRRKRMEEEGDPNFFMLRDKMSFCKQTWWMMLFMLLILQAALCTPATWLLSVKAIPVMTLICEGPALVRHQA